MTEHLAELFSVIEASEIDKACYLSLGQLAPKFVGLEFQLAEKMMIRVVAAVTHLSNSEVVEVYKQIGDLGQTLEVLASKNPRLLVDQKLSLTQVFNRLIEIAKESGKGSQERKIVGITNLLQSVDVLSTKFLVRIPLKKLRLGFSDMTILDGLSWMSQGNKTLRPELEHAFNVRADIGQIAQIFKSEGIEAINKIIPVPGTPIRPAKATPLSSAQEVFEKLKDQLALEPKFDGFRVQIHFDKDRDFRIKKEESLSLFETAKEKTLPVQIFSRNLDNITHMFPELVSSAENLSVNSIILDGEAVAIDIQTGQILDFQETVKRKRKHDISEVSAKIPLRAYIFDILYLNGKSLIKLSFSERRKYLVDIFKEIKPDSSLTLAEQEVVDNVPAFQSFFQRMAKGGLEGLMAKKIDASYRAGARDFTWVKYKLATQTELADTVDAIVMGYFKGKGKWTQFGMGKVLVGIPVDGKIISLSKVGSGFSEESMKEMVKRCTKFETPVKPKEYEVDKSLIPDVWVDPGILIEIKADSISKSPIYKTGLSLRFPRFVHFRDDKDISEATTLKEVKGFAKEQENRDY